MKPTLYADDMGLHCRAENLLARILPKRCDCPAAFKDGLDPLIVSYCDACDERGWLYPDKPDASFDEFRWGTVCRHVWRAMGIVE